MTMRQWMLRSALQRSAVLAHSASSHGSGFGIASTRVAALGGSVWTSNARALSVSSVPDRRKRNHFQHNKKQKKQDASDKKETKGDGGHKASASAPKKHRSFIKSRPADKQTAVFTNKFQNLLSFSLDDEDEDDDADDEKDATAKAQNASRGQKKNVAGEDVAESLLLGKNLLGLSAFGLDDTERSPTGAKKQPHHHLRHKDRVKKEHELSDSSASSSTDSKVKQGKNTQKKKKDSRSLLKNFKFENSIFDSDDELFDHIDWDGEKQDRREQRRMERDQRMRKTREPMKINVQPQEVEIPTSITVKDLAERMAVKSRVLLRALKDLGERGLGDDSVLTNDVAELAVEELGMVPVLLPPEFVDLELTVPPADCSMFPIRPPILSVMGHVDHGKTTLLDALRKSNVAASEHGGITQSIGAFTVNIGKNFGKLSTMTFIDTPGHAAFSSMRARGSEVTDMIVLVVAADDGVRPQTVEVVNLAVKNNVPVVLAVTKCDMHGLEEDEVIERISGELLGHGLVTEPMGGDVPVVCVSGKTGHGLDSLKETIALHAEMLDMRADTKAKGEAVVLEANIARGVGVQVDAIVKWGTLKNGDIVVCGLEHGKVRALVDQNGKRNKTVAPGNPVRVIGLKGLVNAGDALLVVENEERAKEVIEQRRELIEWDLMAAAAEQEDAASDGGDGQRRRKFRGARRKWEEIELRRRHAADEAKRIAALKAGDEGYVASVVPIIVKTDAVGVIAAIDDLIASLPSDEAAIKRILASVGPVTSSDVEMAAATGATIYAFNVKHPGSIDKEALEKNVSLRQHRVIYSMLDDIKELLRDNLAGVEQEEVIGSAEIVQAIPITTSGRRTTNIAGCRVTVGSMTMQAKYRLVRDGEVVADNLNMSSMRHFQERVSEVTKGQECGLQLQDVDDFQPGDILQAYTLKVVKQQL